MRPSNSNMCGALVRGSAASQAYPVHRLSVTFRSDRFRDPLELPWLGVAPVACRLPGLPSVDVAGGCRRVDPDRSNPLMVIVPPSQRTATPQ